MICTLPVSMASEMYMALLMSVVKTQPCGGLRIDLG